MKGIRKDLRIFAVLLAAYALVLHTLLMGMAGVANAAPGTVVICSVAQAGSADTDGSANGHASVPDCCLTRTPVLPAAWGGVSLPVIFAPIERPIFPVAFRDRVPNPSQHLHAPMMARAPPSVA